MDSCVLWEQEMTIRWFSYILACVLLVGCHDTPRNNPFDPALTPAVGLTSVAVNDTTGSAYLKWTAYAGRQPFAAYRVFRKEKGREIVHTLGVIEDVRRTTFRDSTLAPGVEYVYWITVVNQSGFEVPRIEMLEASYELSPVELRSADFSSDTATAELTWTAYRAYSSTRTTDYSKECALVLKSLDSIILQRSAEPYLLVSRIVFPAWPPMLSDVFFRG